MKKAGQRSHIQANAKNEIGKSRENKLNDNSIENEEIPPSEVKNRDCIRNSAKRTRKSFSNEENASSNTVNRLQGSCPEDHSDYDAHDNDADESERKHAAKKSKSKSSANRLEGEGTKPKRPMSAYNFFFKEERAKITSEITKAMANGQEKKYLSTLGVDELELETNVKSGAKKKMFKGIVSFETIGKIVGQRWKNIDEETLEKYNHMAERESSRYREAMDKYYKEENARRREKLFHGVLDTSLGSGHEPKTPKSPEKNNFFDNNLKSDRNTANTQSPFAYGQDSSYNITQSSVRNNVNISIDLGIASGQLSNSSVPSQYTGQEHHSSNYAQANNSLHSAPKDDNEILNSLINQMQGSTVQNQQQEVLALVEYITHQIKWSSNEANQRTQIQNLLQFPANYNSTGITGNQSPGQSEMDGQRQVHISYCNEIAQQQSQSYHLLQSIIANIGNQASVAASQSQASTNANFISNSSHQTLSNLGNLLAPTPNVAGQQVNINDLASLLLLSQIQSGNVHSQQQNLAQQLK